MENKIVTVISAKEKFNLGIKELIQYKDLFFTLAWRDFKVRYAQTFLGFAWALIQPILLMVVMTMLFSKMMEKGTMGYFGINSYAYTMSGTILWGFFSYVLTNSGNSIIGAQGMIKKIYFPRLIIPLSKAVVGLIDFSIGFVILLVIMIWVRADVSNQVLMCLFFLFTTICAALGVGIWISALTIRYRDFQHITPLLVQLGLFVTPVGYPADVVIHRDDISKFFQVLYFINPMAGNIQGFRYYLFHSSDLNMLAPSLLTMVSVFMSFALLLSSVIYFKKVEKDIADIV